jgi:hypothetical protein
MEFLMEDDVIDLGGLEPVGWMRVRNLIERVCAQCAFSVKEDKDRVCRVEPPRVFMFMVPVTQAPVPGLRPQQGFQITSHSQFPVVRDDQWCGKHEPRRG